MHRIANRKWLHGFDSSAFLQPDQQFIEIRTFGSYSGHFDQVGRNHDEDKSKDGFDPQTNYTKVIVKDNGIGFDSADAVKIFQTFARLNPKNHFEGTGLGLALCKKIVERHGGSIYAGGKVRQGAKFTILFP